MAYPTTPRFVANMTGTIGNVAGTTPTGMVSIYDADSGAGVTKRVRCSTTLGDATIDNVSGIYQGGYFISPGKSATVDQVSNGGVGAAGELYRNENVFFVRRQTVSGSDHFIKVVFSLQNGAIGVITTRASGSYIPVNRVTGEYLTSSYPPTFDIVDNNRHECRWWIEDNGVGGESLRIKVTDLTANVVRQDYTYTLHAEDSTQGDMGFVASTLLRHFEYIEFAETPILVGPPTQTITKKSTESSVEITITPVGGNAPVTVHLYESDGITDTPGSPQTYSGSPLVFNVSGLDPAHHYVFYATSIDDTDQQASEGVDIFTRPAEIPIAARGIAIGDSITVDSAANINIAGVDLGAQRIDAALTKVIKTTYNLTDATCDSVAVAQSGATPEEIADLVDEAVLVADGGYSGAHTYGGTLNGIADYAFIRVGKNWAPLEGETNAQAATRCLGIVQGMIDRLKSETSITKIFIGKITGYSGSGAEDPVTADRQYLTNKAYETLHNPAGGIWVEDDMVWNSPIVDTTLLRDGVHPGARMRGLMLMSYVAMFNRSVYPVVGGTSSGGGSTGGVLNMGSPEVMVEDAVPYTPDDDAMLSDTVSLSDQYGIFAETGGDLVITTAKGTERTIPISSGGTIYVRARKIKATGTTASGIFVLSGRS